MSMAHCTTVRERLMVLIASVTSDGRRFKELKEKTSLPPGTWRSFWNRNGAVPSGTMLEDIAREWPQYAFWLVTGITDPDAGHVAPPGGAPGLMKDETSEKPQATDYFRYQLEAKDPPKQTGGNLDLSSLDESLWKERVESYMRDKGWDRGPDHTKRKLTSYIDLAVLDEQPSKKWLEAFARAERELREQDKLAKQQFDNARSAEIARTLNALRKRKAS